MGILGSVFGRGLAGAAAAAGQLASKYIDQDLMAQRDQALADLRIKTEGTIRQDELNFRTDPGNLDKSNAAARTTAMAAGDTATEVETRRLGNTGLNDAARAKADDEARAARGRKTEELLDPTLNAANQAKLDADTEAEIKRKSTPEAIAAERAHARARHVESAGSIAQAATEQFKLGAMRRVDDLSQQIAKAEKDGDRAGADSLQSQRDALTDKGGKSAQFATVAEKAATAMTPALKIMADPMATEDAKEEARTTVRQQRAILETFAKRAGVDLGATKQVDPYAVPRRGDKPADKADPYAPKPGGPSIVDRAAAKAATSGGVSIDEQVRLAQRPVIDPAERSERTAAYAAKRSAAAADPELMALDGERGNLLRMGKAPQANAAMERFKALRQERYGF